MPPSASQSYTFDPRPRYPLLLTVKRYWDPSSPHLDDPNAPTLVFTHGTGFHKELYEPTIAELYARIDGAQAGPKVRDVWSIDAPNHGDAAVLNERALRDGYDEPVFGWQEYARGLHALLAGLGTGVEDVDFRARRLVLVGHSMAAAVIVLALTYQPVLTPVFLIMVEMMGINPQAVPALMKTLTDGSAQRRDVWPSRAEAYRLLKARPAWCAWDDRVLRIFVETGLRPLPTLEYPDGGIEGVTLKCTRRQETATYRDSLASAVVYRLMRPIVTRFPTHFIQGAVDDHLCASIPHGDSFIYIRSARSRAVKDDFLVNAVGGAHNLASVARVPGAGHLVVQTHPTGLATAMFGVLKTEAERDGLPVRGKL